MTDYLSHEWCKIIPISCAAEHVLFFSFFSFFAYSYFQCLINIWIRKPFKYSEHIFPFFSQTAWSETSLFLSGIWSLLPRQSLSDRFCVYTPKDSYGHATQFPNPRNCRNTVQCTASVTVLQPFDQGVFLIPVPFRMLVLFINL